jgi:hypothetical protein
MDNRSMVRNALRELDALIAKLDGIHQSTILMRNDINLLLELRRRFLKLQEQLK